jgi:hypothetical protein
MIMSSKVEAWHHRITPSFQSAWVQAAPTFNVAFVGRVDPGLAGRQPWILHLFILNPKTVNTEVWTLYSVS